MNKTIKNKNRIKYIASFKISGDNEENWVIPMSSHNVSLYYIRLLNSIGYAVDAISILKTKDSYCDHKTVVVEDGVNKLTRIPAAGTKLNFIKTIYLNFALCRYLIKESNKGEEIVVYHGIAQIPALIIAKIVKKLRYILYVAEIYHDTCSHKIYHTWFENYFISIADKYIFISDRLADKLNKKGKPSIVIQGLFEKEKIFGESFGDKKIHIIYAGIINEDKGAFQTVEIARYLDAGYHIHIAGYGNDKDIKRIIEMIHISNKTNKCIVHFEGNMHGEDYKRLLQKCHIGLCPQIKNKKYNNSSFPSKISVYLANGLRVIAPDVDIIRGSVFGDILIYYDELDPMKLAKIVRKIDIEENYDSRAIINECNKKALIDMEYLINEKKNNSFK